MLQLAALPFPNIDPILFKLGPLQIHWYGLGYIVGILFAWWYSRMLVTNTRLWGGKQITIKPKDLDDFLAWAVVGIIVGGRLGYVFFYDFAAFLQAPATVIAIWKGGMSFHGGLIGTLLAVIGFAYSRGFSPFSLFDIITASAPVGIVAVRFANFINGELFGKPTNLPWGIIFPDGGPQPRHPSQLYEAALEGLVMFIILRLLTHGLGKLSQPGYVGGAAILWYALSRIMVEFVRLPDAQIGYLAGGWLTMGMLLSLPMALIGIWAITTSSTRT